MKRFLGIFLSLLLLGGTVPPAALAAETGEEGLSWERFEAFSSQISELLEETMDDNYLSSVSLRIGEESMTINGETQEVLEDRDAAPYLKDEQVMVPVRTLAQCRDASVSYNGSSKTATVQTEEAELSFTAGDTVAFSRDGGEESATLLSTTPEIVEGTMYVPLEDAAPSLGYEVVEDDGKALLTRPFQTKRLVVKSAEERLDPLGAEQVIAGFQDLHVFQYRTEEEAREACALYQKMEGVKYAEPDRVVWAAEVSASSTTHKSWGVDYIGADTYSDFLRQGSSMPQVVVAVADTGVDGEHTFLKDRLVSGGRSYIDGESSAYTDGHSHGTHVAGIVADTAPENVKILPIKILNSSGTGTDLSVNNGVWHAILKKCDIINLSLSGYGGISYDRDALNAAMENGLTVVAAAGNEGMNASLFSPAQLLDAITVGAIADSGLRAAYSNYGDVVDVWAPGSAINSTIPGNKYGSKSGTSMAAPFVSAAAAMLKTWDPDLSPRQIEGILTDNARNAYIEEPGRKGYSKVLELSGLIELQPAETAAVEPVTAVKEESKEEFTVTLACATAGAQIRYTTDGTVPTEDTGTPYTEPLTFNCPTKLLARAFLEGAMDSPVLERRYFISEYPESFHYAEDAYYDIWDYTATDPNTKYIKITFDENTDLPFPEASGIGAGKSDYDSGRKYEYGLFIYDENDNGVKNEFADVERESFIGRELAGKSVIVEGKRFSLMLSMPLGTEDYGFKVTNVEELTEDRLSPPVFVTSSGNSYSPIKYGQTFRTYSTLHNEENMEITLSCEAGAEIRYTLDGSLPTEDSALYTAPILLSEPTKITARAYRAGSIESAAASETYYSSPYPESLHHVKHDYYVNYRWNAFQAPAGTAYMAVTFDEQTDLGSGENGFNMSLRIRDKATEAQSSFATTWTGRALAGETVLVQGDRFTIEQWGDQPEGVEAPYGFKITDVQCFRDDSSFVSPTSLTISGPDMITAGQTVQYRANVLPSNANVIWCCDPGPSAVMDANGNLTALSKGVVYIYAYSGLANQGGIRAYKTVTIEPLQSSVSAPPQGKALTYNGKAQALAEPGTASGGTMEYSLQETVGFSSAIPTGTDAGEYTVWYRVKGDDAHGDVPPASLTVTIEKADQPQNIPQNIVTATETSLSGLPLPRGWAWKNSAGVLTPGDNSVTVVYEDGKNYKKAEFSIKVHLHDLKKTEEKPATCTQRGNSVYWTCSACAEIYADANASSPTTLEDCTLEQLGHTPGEGATCTEDQICTVCKAVLEGAFGHDYRDSVTAPTCTEQGYTVHTCSRCGYSFQDTVTDALGHKPGEWQEIRPATEQQAGMRQKVCSVCGKAVETETIPQLSSGGSSTPTPPVTPPGPFVPAGPGGTDVTAPEITENPDGSTTATETAEDGTVTVLTTWKDGKQAAAVTTPEGEMEITVVDGKGGTMANVSIPAVIPLGKQYEDVKASDWFEGSVSKATGLGLFTGTSETLFSPKGNVTRGMLVTTLYRLSGEPAYGVGKNVFEDVDPTAWYAKAADWANTVGVASGTGNGFNPKGNVTRQDMAAMLYRYAKTIGARPGQSASLSRFTDGDKVSGYAAEAMGWAVSAGIIGGKGNDILDPKGQATRAEAAAILTRFVEYLKKK